MPRREREGGRERGREGEISDIKKAPLLRRAALKMSKRRRRRGRRRNFLSLS